GHVADAGADRPQVAHDVHSQQRGRTLVRQDQGGEDAEERGLASAVGTDQAEQLRLADLERDSVQRNRVSEPLRQLPHDERRRVRAHLTPPVSAAASMLFPAPGTAPTSAPVFATGPSVMSPGIPILSAPPSFGTRTFTA